jgi:hypothetical protein
MRICTLPLLFYHFPDFEQSPFQPGARPLLIHKALGLRIILSRDVAEMQLGEIGFADFSHWLHIEKI